jgi:pyruvate formate lyase activating enzyme
MKGMTLMKECSYYDRMGEGRVVCRLCPHHCVIGEGRTGLCRSRKNIGGQLFSLAYGHPCAIADDPIEKKPLALWHPGTRCLSLACTGCNLRCPNCQNYTISQVGPNDVPSDDCSPEQMVMLARQHHLPTIAYTYTEPLTWMEYMYDIARLAHEAGLYNVLVSAGYVNEQPLCDLAPLLDAANIDLKSFSDDIYRHYNGASLAPVLRTLTILREAGVHLEITLLLIPGINTDDTMLHSMFRWLADNGMADCALHISRFFPMYKMLSAPPTPLADMRRAEAIAHAEGIIHVFLGNV